ncbi:hypothetical protein HDU83_006042 [Entophlyctis luteolus]|nr:hypothetical protein HDU83_006042 [Entophlyctis luteolus]
MSTTAPTSPTHDSDKQSPASARIASLEELLRAKEMEVQLAATIGQNLLSQVNSSKTRIAELEAQLKHVPQHLPRTDHSTPKAAAAPTPVASKIPLARSSATRKAQVTQLTNAPLPPPPGESPLPTNSARELQSKRLTSAGTGSQIRKDYAIDPKLAMHIENSLVLHARSLTVKVNAIESANALLKQKCESMETENDILRAQNEKLIASERTLNEKLWNLEMLNQQLRNTNDSLQKEVNRHLQKIKSYEKELTHVQELSDALRESEKIWKEERQSLVVKLESEAGRNRREISRLTCENSKLEKRIEDMNGSCNGLIQYRAATAPSFKLPLRPHSFITLPDEAQKNSPSDAKVLNVAQDSQIATALSTALAHAHADNQELRRENANLVQSSRELERMLQEANETIDAMRMGCDLSMVVPVAGVGENSMSLHDQLVMFSGDDILVSQLPPCADNSGQQPLKIVGTQNILQELEGGEFRPGPSTAAEALTLLPLEKNLEKADCACQTEELLRFRKSRSILQDLSAIYPCGLGADEMEDPSDTGEADVSFSSFAGSFGTCANKSSELKMQSDSPVQLSRSSFPEKISRSPELTGESSRRPRHKTEFSFDHQANEYVQYDSTAIEALTSTMIGTWVSQAHLFLEVDRTARSF